MGARQSKRSVDITTTPKKGDNETAAISEDKIEKLGDADVEVVTNGTAAHTDIEFADKDDTKEAKENVATEVKENGLPDSSDGEKTPDKEAATPAAGDQPEATLEKISENGEKTAETPDAKKPKDKKKKKWSLRSISFSKKDKSKPGKEKEKNGEVEDVNEEKEEETPKTPEEVKTEESKEAEEAKIEPTNDEAKKEEVAVKTSESVVPATEAKMEPVVTPTEKAAVEETKEEEKEKPVEQEVCAKPLKVEEPTIAPTEEVKEVRNEELPPPLPNSNPPSQVAVFAESLKDDALPMIETNSSPVESRCQPEKEPVTVDPPANPEHTDESVIETSELATELETSQVEADATVIESSESIIKLESSQVESDKTVIESSESVTKLESSQLKTEESVIESSQVESVTHVIESSPVEKNLSSIESAPEVSEPSNESPPAIQSVGPQDEECKNGSSKEILENSTVIPCVEVVKTIENETVSSKNDSDVPVVLSAFKEEDEPKSGEHCDIDIPSAGDSSPFIIENLSNSTNDTNQDLPSNTTIVTNDSTLSTQPSETTNLAKEDSKLEFKIEDQESSDSVSSVPVIIEEQLPVVSSAGDVPNPLDSQTSLELDNDNTLQEFKSNLNLKESTTSQESNLYSEEPSLDLSTIPEAVESSESKLAEESECVPELSSSVPNVELNETTNSIVEKQDEKDSAKVEMLCNADSLADLSTESLPSLPEPTDSVLEPMSLPPLDFVPDPLVDDNLPAESLATKPNETEPEVILTNGNATNGLKSSPTAEDDDTPPPPPPDGPLKQQLISSEPSVVACEISKSTEEKAETVDSTQSEAQ